MKMKMTRPQILRNYENVVSVGYCGAAHLLQGLEPIGYASGVYGWNYDVYSTGGVTICTGYRAMPGRTAARTAEYEKRARDAMDDYSAPWAERAARVDQIRAEWLRVNGGRCYD